MHIHNVINSIKYCNLRIWTWLILYLLKFNNLNYFRKVNIWKEEWMFFFLFHANIAEQIWHRDRILTMGSSNHNHFILNLHAHIYWRVYDQGILYQSTFGRCRIFVSELWWQWDVIIFINKYRTDIDLYNPTTYIHKEIYTYKYISYPT